MNKILEKIKKLEKQALEKFKFSSSTSDGDYCLEFKQNKGFSISKKTAYENALGKYVYNRKISFDENLMNENIEVINEVFNAVIRFFDHLKDQANRLENIDSKLNLVLLTQG